MRTAGMRIAALGAAFALASATPLLSVAADGEGQPEATPAPTKIAIPEFTAKAPAPPAKSAGSAQPNRGKPSVLRAHLNKLKQAMPPGPPGSIEGIGASGDGGFEARAYPDTDIPL